MNHKEKMSKDKELAVSYAAMKLTNIIRRSGGIHISQPDAELFAKVLEDLYVTAARNAMYTLDAMLP